MRYNGCGKTKESDIPHCTKATEAVLQQAEIIQANLAEEIKVSTVICVYETLLINYQESPGRISLTFDAWTLKIMTSYLAAMGHWLTAEWQLCSELISFAEIEGSHSGENMGQILYDILDQYNIRDKVKLFNSDFCKCNLSLFRLKI